MSYRVTLSCDIPDTVGVLALAATLAKASAEVERLLDTLTLADALRSSPAVEVRLEAVGEAAASS